MSDFEVAVDGARCRVWPDGPDWKGTPAAAIGELEFGSVETGAAVLELARERLIAGGCGAVLAPMAGDTWRAYRAVTMSDGSPPFALEPVSGPHDVAALVSAGFGAVSEYVSARAAVPLAASAAPAVPGIIVRAWDGAGAEALLERLLAMAGQSFADKLFFKPIDREGFLGLYRPLLPLVDPRLVLFALDAGGELVGFLFGLPEPTTRAAVLKTYAGRRPGIGRLLAHEFHERARELGYSHVIHALMHVENVSLTRSGQHGGTVFRRYTLFGRPVA